MYIIYCNAGLPMMSTREYHRMEPIPGPSKMMRKMNSTPYNPIAQYSQVMSKKTEIKFGMSPLKTKKYSADLIKSPNKIKKEFDKTDLTQSFGMWSFRSPHVKSEITYQHKSNDMNSKSKTLNSESDDTTNRPKKNLKGWLKGEIIFPKTPLRRSVSDSRNITRTGEPTRQGRKDQELTQGIKSHQEETFKTNVKRNGFRNKTKDKEGAANKATKPKETNFVEARPRSLLQRSISDLKQRTIAARNFLNSQDMKEDSYRPPKIQPVTDKPEDLSDANSHDLEPFSEMFDIKEKNGISDHNENHQSIQFGSILRRPGNKRQNIKHVEFLETIGYEEEDCIRYV